MKFVGRRASEYGREFNVEINSLEELIEYINENGSIIIEKWDEEHELAYQLIIYDDYIE